MCTRTHEKKYSRAHLDRIYDYVKFHAGLYTAVFGAFIAYANLIEFKSAFVLASLALALILLVIAGVLCARTLTALVDRNKEGCWQENIVAEDQSRELFTPHKPIARWITAKNRYFWSAVVSGLIAITVHMCSSISWDELRRAVKQPQAVSVGVKPR